MRKVTTNPKTPNRGPIVHTAEGVGPAQDYSYRPDDKVYAPCDGEIITSDVAGACGLRVVYVSSTGNTKWYMCHFQTKKRVGKYKQGDVLGVMGDTGLSQGRHLHLAMWKKVDGKWKRVLNPDKWQNDRRKAIARTRATIKKQEAKLKKLEEC